MKKNVMFVVLALAVLGGLAQAQPHPANAYRLAFITSTTIGVPWDLSVNMDAADLHIQNLADGVGLGNGGYVTDPVTGAPINLQWSIIGSTTYEDARDHTGTNPNVSAGVPIYLVDFATKVADDNADLWDGDVDNIINIDENGNTFSHWPHTGTYLDGTAADPSTEPSHGGPMDTASIAQGNGGATTEWVWRTWTARPPSEALPVYGISDIIPEPATMCLLGLGGLLLRRKR